MSYQVIARKWRPQSFGQLVGQNHVTQTLLNALKNQRLPHALLFTGPRGTGKTSSARILAKSLRCLQSTDYVPCNQCTSCLEIASSTSPDVRELDAASNNSVDDMRELLSGVMHLPAQGKYKIYIIDEVHMLSTSAFNALLKTLEEPPPHVIFILATTEVQKIPQTILSRCQRFDFRRIPTRQITERLKLVCESENIPFDEDALWMIGRQADGSLRDSQSLLDQVITYCEGKLTQEKVLQILGLTDRTLLLETLNSLCARDTQGILRLIEKLNQTSVEPKLFSQELLESLRNLLLTKISASEMSEVLDLPDSELKALAEMGAQLSEEEIHFLFDMALKGINDLSRTQDPKLVLEMLLLRMASAPRLVDLKSLIKNPFQSSPVANLDFKKVALPKVEITTAATAITPPAKAAEPPPAKPSGPLDISKPEHWLSFVDRVREKDSLFAAKIENFLFVKEQNKVLFLAIPPKLVFLKEQMKDAEVRKKLKSFIDSILGPGYDFQMLEDQVGGESAHALAAKKMQQADQELRNQISEHPTVKAAQDVFKGQIKSIQPMKEKEG